jgi:hypothetical protein
MIFRGPAMPTASVSTTYYSVTWTGNTPTDYNSLTGNQAGGIDNSNAESYNRRVSITGTHASPTVTAGHSIIINEVEIFFTSTTLAQCIIDINAYANKTNIIAHQGLVANYITLTNSVGYEDQSFSLLAGSVGTALSDLGLTAGSYKYWPCVLGTSVTLPLTNNDNIVINGVNVAFTTAGGLDIAGVVTTINSLTYLHNVIAYAAANVIQLVGASGQPWLLAAGTSSGTLANLGFVAGTHGGYPDSFALSINKEYATMRWEQIVNNLGLLISPVVIRDFVKTTDYTGESPLVTMQWTVGYDRPEYLSIVDITSGATPQPLLTDVNTIKRLVATALTVDINSNREIFDPTIKTFGANCNRVNSSQIVNLTAGALDTVIANLEAQITVSLLGTV